MTHLDPDPLTVEEDVWSARGSETDLSRIEWLPERSTPSLTIPLVLLCAVVGAVFVAWLVTR